MTDIVWADESRFQDILTLWQQGFPADSEEDVRAFWNALNSEARCLLLTEDGEARSMAFVIPATLCGHTVWYVYAAATARAYRGQGYFRRLLEETSRRAEQAGVYGLFLRPGEPALFAYYARLGFVTSFWLEELPCKVDALYDEDDLVWEPVMQNFAAHRSRWLTRCGVSAVGWSEPVTAYAVSLLETGGMLVSDKGLVMYRRDGEHIAITELLCAAEDTETVLQSLTRHFACQITSVYRPTGSSENGRPYGMFRAIQGEYTENGVWYMGFSLE